MSEAYLITGSQLPAGTSLEALLQDVLKTGGLKPNQVTEIHLFTDAASALFERKRDTIFGSVIQWPLIPHLSVSTLFSACRALETGELTSCVLVENTAQQASAILLANPSAVGRLNLAPKVMLSLRSNHPEGITDLPDCAAKLLARIPKEEPDAENDAPDLRVAPKKPARPWLAIHSSAPAGIPEWPEDRVLTGASIFPLLIKLADAVEKSKTDPAVWMHLQPGEPGDAMLVLPL
jgi:hypothetical protein